MSARVLCCCTSKRLTRSFATTTYRRATEVAASASSSKVVNPKIDTIVDQISKLSLLEAADLVQALKTRLNISEVTYAAPAASASTSAPAAASEDAAPAEAEKPKEKTLFNVNLKKIDAAQKAKAIKEVKAVMPNMNLVEAKKFVESLPKVLKENVTKEEAEKLKKALEAIGAEVSLD